MEKYYALVSRLEGLCRPLGRSGADLGRGRRRNYRAVFTLPSA